MTRLSGLTRPLGGLALAAALTLSAAACGKDEAPAVTESDVATAALASQIADKLPTDQALCTAKALVADLGVAGVHKAGFVNDDDVAQLNRQFERPAAAALADATVGCWDWREHTTTLAPLYPKADAKAWDAYVACAEKLDAQLRASITEANTKGGASAPQAELATAEQQCRKPLGKPATATN